MSEPRDPLPVPLPREWVDFVAEADSLPLGGGPGRGFISREDLDSLAHSRHLDARAWARAREIVAFVPDASGWQRIVGVAVTLAGALFLATAVVFFLAYNWDALGRFARLALVVASLVAVAVAAIWRGQSMSGRAAHFAAMGVAGALLAYIGQTYQTGADPWQLFAAWAVLVLPWALSAAWAPTWALVLLLANVALGLYFTQVPRDPGGTSPEILMVTSATAMNAAAAVLAELWGPRGEAGTFRLLPRVAVMAALGFATSGLMYFVFRSGWDHSQLLLGYLVVVAATYWAYRVRSLDLLILSVLALSAIVAITTVIAKTLSEIGNMAFWMLLLAMMVVGLSAWAAHWIRGLAREEAAR